MTIVESGLNQLAGLFLTPVLLLIGLSLAYSLTALGAFAVEAWQRRRGAYVSILAVRRQQTGCHSDDLELLIMKQLEWLRVVARSAPMLGLVATMIPMGPALTALTRNEAQGIGEHMTLAFSAVILSLVAASIAFFILTLRRRWLLEDLRAVERAAAATSAGGV